MTTAQMIIGAVGGVILMLVLMLMIYAFVLMLMIYAFVTLCPAPNLPSYFSFQPVLHDWFINKGHGMCHPVCGMVHIKEP